ncbi:MAG TPA: SH3 domain-containing protein [Thermoflexales bacterium]|jgi:SH3-like domain-containing protein|nr:SH3 domain-containing protein [Thermoflexales bacterium]
MALTHRHSIAHGLMAAMAAALCLAAPGAVQARDGARYVADDPEPDPGRIRLSVGWADPSIIGRFIGDGITTVVQFRNASGQWQDVSGWVQPLRNTSTVLWNVWRRDWGTGPYRWLVKNEAQNYVMATSTGFYLPGAGTYLDIAVVIPANVGPPPPVTSALPPGLLTGSTAVNNPSARALVTASSVDVRREPNEASFAFAELRRGVNAQVLAVSKDGRWIQIKADGVEGWIRSTAGISLNSAAASAGRPDPAAQAFVVAAYVDVRRAPSATSVAFAEFRRGVVAQVLNASPDRQWYLMSAGGVSGWVSANDRLSLSAAAKRVPILSDYPVAVVAVPRLTIRALPTTSSVALHVLKRGDEVEVMAASADGAWFNVRFGGVTGWVYVESTLTY